MSLAEDISVNDSDNEECYLNLDIFNSYYIDEILDLVYYIKDIFSITPYFLYYINVQNLIDLFILSKNNTKSLINNEYEYNFYKFIKEFENEIIVGFNIVNSYLKKFKIKCNYNYWCLFCYQYSYKIYL